MTADDMGVSHKGNCINQDMLLFSNLQVSWMFVYMWNMCYYQKRNQNHMTKLSKNGLKLLEIVQTPIFEE